MAMDPLFGDLLKRYRRSAGLTQEELADRAGLSPKAITALERGVSRAPRKETLELLATALQLGTPERTLLEAAARARDSLTPVHADAAGLAVPTDARRALPQTNPFTYGNAISEPARFFGRQREIAQIFSRLCNDEFESSSLVGGRSMGKTSILNYLAHPQVRRAHGLDLDTYLFTYLDLQMLDRDTTPAQLWKQILRQMARCAPNAEVRRILDKTRATAALNTFALANLFSNIDRHDQHIVLLLDEFEAVTKNPNFGADFFYGLRSLAIHHNLALITSSRQELVELCHSESIRSSPFFNIFANINVGLFTEAEAQELITCSLAKSDIQFTAAELERIFRLAGYHPYFLQIACSFLFDAYTHHLSPDERITYLSREYREKATPQLDNYWHSSDDHEKIILMALTLLERQAKGHEYAFSSQQLQALYTRSDQILLRLEKRGLVTSRADRYALLNASLSAWIYREITNTAHDQQGYGDWLKSNRAALELLPARAKKDIGAVLPQMSHRYRSLIVRWISDPRNLPALPLLKATVGVP
jgi:transcriptional regulator with XRE-family HTH domain